LIDLTDEGHSWIETIAPTPTPTPTGTGSGSGTARCSASLHVDNQWGNGFTATVTVSNPGTVATKTWKVTWTWSGNQVISNAWNAAVTSSGTSVTALNMPYNNVIAPAGNTAFGMQAGFSGTNAAPTLTCSAT
jgi:cellulase/cellobiase CelA1